MSKYLIQTVETYRADTESEAEQLIADAKASSEYELKKHNAEKKEIKQKGEVVDEYWKVSLTKKFTDEKEPIGSTTITYDNSEGSAF